MTEDFASVKLAEIRGISREEMRAIEGAAYLSGTSPDELMRRAGLGVAEFLRRNTEGGLLFLASSSNNGGDALVAAAALADERDVTVVQLATKPMRTEEGKNAEQVLEEKTCRLLQVIPPDCDPHNFESPRSERWEPITVVDYVELLNSAQVIVDGIFGINIRTALRSPWEMYIAPLAKLCPPDGEPKCRLFSIDIPSGLDCNTGEWLGSEFAPEKVLTMQFSKYALEKCELPYELIDIGLDTPAAYQTNDAYFVHMWRPRDPNSHKGINGRLLVIGGSDEFTGAPVLSSNAALRCGVDTVRTVVPESIRDIVAGYSENFLVTKVKGQYHGPKSLKYLVDLATRRDYKVVMGMGISNKQDVWKFVREFVKKVSPRLQLILDADALRAFRGHVDLLKGTGAILTPHRAELRYFLQEDIPKDPQELVDFLESHALELGVTIVLKGKVDVITNGRRTILNPTGHAGMTVGGTGDVLAGIIGASTCFVDDPFFAAVIGTYVMGRAGERAAEKFGNSLLATDIIKEIPGVLMELEARRGQA